MTQHEEYFRLAEVLINVSESTLGAGRSVDHFAFQYAQIILLLLDAAAYSSLLERFASDLQLQGCLQLYHTFYKDKFFSPETDFYMRSTPK